MAAAVLSAATAAAAVAATADNDASASLTAAASAPLAAAVGAFGFPIGATVAGFASHGSAAAAAAIVPRSATADVPRFPTRYFAAVDADAEADCARCAAAPMPAARLQTHKRASLRQRRNVPAQLQVD